MTAVGSAAYLVVSLVRVHPFAASDITSQVTETHPAALASAATTPADAAAGRAAAPAVAAKPGLRTAPAPLAATTTQPPALDAAALTELRGEIAAMKQQLQTTSASYAQANANYQQTREALAALSTQHNQLQAQLTDAMNRIKAAQEARDEAERRAKAAELALNSKSSNASQLAKIVDTSKSELAASETERTNLQNRVQQLQLELQSAETRTRQLNAQLDAKTQQLQQLAADPNRAAAIAPGGVSPGFVPQALPQNAVVPPNQNPPAASPHAQRSTSSELEKLLASTGLDVDRMLKSFDALAEGGPYIALNDPRAVAADQQRLADLKRLAKELPLAAPVKDYTLGSPFGPRIDPINRRESFHPGLDLDAPYKTPVYSTAPGTVIFTGTMDSYGRMVEIDHGHGIVTRYAHLHRILVAKGQKVALHTEIGELGSTGRSTGPHLHYEVRVDGTTVDPTKFMEAGKNVVQVSGK